jgi:hypothetical protein
VTGTDAEPSRRAATGPVLAAWPFALGACLLLFGGRFAACHRDASSYGNAWTEDQFGYCTNSGWDALTGGAGRGPLVALALLAVTAALPATVLVCATLVSARRRHAGRLSRAWPLVAGIGTVAVVAFYLKWGHVSIIGGAGG